MKTFIYALKNPINNKIFYIGKSNKPKQRLSSHISRTKILKTPTSKFIISLLEQNTKPELMILEEISIIEWEEKEKFYIEKYTLENELTNLSKGGKGNTGFFHSKETKLLMSKNRKEKQNSFYGKKHTKETILKIKEKNILHNKKNKELGINNAFYGKKHSQETKNIMSKKAKERWEKGNMHLPPKLIGKNNPSAKETKLISPLGEEFITFCLRKFCLNYNLSEKTIRKNINLGKIKAIEDPKLKSKQRKKSLNCIGWEVKREK